MKLSKILVAVATISVVSAASAADIPPGTPILNGLNTSEGPGGVNGPATGVSAVAVITDCNTRNALQHMQDMSSCVGNNSKLCAPNISSAELRAMLTGAVGATTAISGAAGTLAASLTTTAGTAGCAAPALGANAGIQFRQAAGTDHAVQQFLGNGAIDGLIAGAGDASGASGQTDDAACITNVVANGRVRFCTVHATSLSDSNNAGFVKLDGAAPDLANLMSSNYNLVSNLHGLVIPSTTVSAHSTTFGAYVAAGGNMDGDGVAYHTAAGGGSFAAAPLSTRGSNPDLDSKGQ